MSNTSKYQVVKTDEGDWSIVIDRDGTMIPIAMSIMDEAIAWEMARHLNNRRGRSVIFRSKQPDAALVITAGKGFHIRFANGRAASVQWGTGNYCDRQDYMRGRAFFEVQLKDESLRKLYTEFDGTTFVNYEQMFADWGCDNAEISPGTGGDSEEGWVTPDQIVDTLYALSKMPAVEDGKEFVDVDSVILKVIEGTSDRDLLDGVSMWKQVDQNRRPRVHEWRNYIPEKILEVWEHLTPRERALCFEFCRQQADAEEWD